MEPDPRRGIFGRVIAIVGHRLGVERRQVVPEATLLDDLGADSLDVVELVMALETEFGIQVPDAEVGNMRTIGDLVSYVRTAASA